MHDFTKNNATTLHINQAQTVFTQLPNLRKLGCYNMDIENSHDSKVIGISMIQLGN